ncbi:formylglycine-generating enzyme family protein [Photobacterium nomapromontoriensis]|uniref:formylglycine-generating enzyme family protein n=1 Tax=Photobacterium nomapromontoriensis TaxID=2910237 RepID=UPI003D121FA6
MSFNDILTISAGNAIIGSDTPSESPQIEIYIPEFSLSKYQVTNQQYSEFIDSCGYENSNFWSEEGFEWLQQNKITCPAFWHMERYTQPTQPVTGVSYYEAEAYARWKKGRLPTEVEWEKAARGAEGFIYPWGDKEPDLTIANFSPDFVPVEIASVAVNKYPHNTSPFGCQQMAGNLYEWCSDYFHTDTPECRNDQFYKEIRESRRRVLKGGAWTVDASRLRAAARWSYTPNLRDNIIGFRVAYDKRK